MSDYRILFALSSLAVAALATPAGSGPRVAPGIDRALAEGPSRFLERAVVGPRGDGAYVVPTSQVVSPAGDTVLFPGRPTDLALSPDGETVAVKNKADVVFIDLATRTIRQTLPMPGAGNSFHGIAFTGDGRHLWTTDAGRHLRRASRGSDGAYAWSAEIPLPGPGGRGNSAPGGFFLDEKTRRAYVALSRNNSIGVVNLETRRVEAEIEVGIAPYTVLRCGRKAYVANWGGRRPGPGDATGPTSGSRVVVDPKTGVPSSGTVSVIDLESGRVLREIDVQLHPSGLALSPNRETLFVANANSDTVSVIDTRTDAVRRTLGVKPMDALPFGSAPNALAVASAGGTLYVANGGNNALGVIDLESGRLRGLIPTGWYPGAVMLTPDGRTLIVANTKGVGSRAKGAEMERKRRRFKPLGESIDGYNTHEHMGSVSILPVPDKRELEAQTLRVAANMRLPLMHRVLNLKAVERRTTPVPSRPGEVSVFKHVLYIIKENRTYDQVFGDLPQGKGEPSLCHFPREVTPNHHALAETFVLLDNFYCNGVLSADGHQWTNEGYVTDYLEKSFGGFTRSYPYEGEDALAFAASGFIWDYVLAKGLTFRDYGEFVKARIAPADATWADIYRDYLEGTRKVKIEATTELHTLEPHLCPDFVGFPGKVQDVYRAQSFIRELRAAERKGEWYNFMIMLLPNDHTVGTREGYPTPRAAVADNDLALGRIVDAVSHSRFWPETAIFVVQDDPQAGLDHVDGHRTVALCVSPYTKRGYVDSTHYNQTGMLRTMELILGLPPMNQIDMASTPMLACFQETPDFTPYTVVPNQVPLDEMNPAVASLQGEQRRYAEASMCLPLDDIDQADEGLFNRILWHSVKGYDVPYPELVRRVVTGPDAWAAGAVPAGGLH